MDNMEKELWDAFYGKESKQERCSVLTEAELNKHNKGMLKEDFMSDEDIHNQFSKFEVLDFSKEGEHSGYIELSFPNADEIDYDSSVITGYTIYEDGKVAFDNWLPDDVYNEVAEYVKQHHSEELDEGCGKKKKKALKENMEYNVPEDIVVAYMIGDTIGNDNFPPSMMRIQKICYDKLGTADTSNVMLLMVDNDKNKWAVIPRDKRSMVKIKKKALEESAEPVYISVDVTRHNGSVIVKSDEFGKITYLPNDFEKLEDTIKRAVNDYAAENNIAEYEVIKLYESKKALKESDEKDSRFIANNLRRIRKIRDAIQAGVDVSWDDMAFLEENRETIKKYFPDDIELWQWANIPEDEWSAHEQSLKESDEDMSGYEDRLNKTIKSEMKKFPKYAADAKKALDDGDEIKKILNKYNQEYNFLYNNHDKVAGYEEAVRAWDEYINHPDFRELIGKVIKARHDMFTSDREIGALMFALDSLGYLDKFDGKESSLEPVVKEFKA